MAKGLKILQILPALESGGVERGVVEISAALRKRGFGIFVASNGGALVPFLTKNNVEHIKINVASKNPLRIFLNIFALKKIIAQKNIDLVHVRSRAPMISAYYACRLAGVRLVSTVHGPYSFKLIGKKFSRLKYWYNSFMVKADRIIAVSNFIKDYVAQNYGFKLESITTVVPRGVDLKNFDPDKIFIDRSLELARKWGLAEDKKVILFPARITSWKGHEFLLEALSKVNGDFTCVFVGSDHGHEKFRKKVEDKVVELGLAGKVKLVGACKDMAVAYNLANLVISASVRPEAFGRVAIEAQAMKKVLIATKIGGSLETVIDGKTGFLVEPWDVAGLTGLIERVLDMDVAQKRKIGEAARQNVRDNFSNEKMCEGVMGVYEKVLGFSR